MEIIKIRDEYIKLGQAMKLSGLADSGLDAKEAIADGMVRVNGETETRRGRKLYRGDIFMYNGMEVKVDASDE